MIEKDQRTRVEGWLPARDIPNYPNRGRTIYQFPENGFLVQDFWHCGLYAYVEYDPETHVITHVLGDKYFKTLEEASEYSKGFPDWSYEWKDPNSSFLSKNDNNRTLKKNVNSSKLRIGLGLFYHIRNNILHHEHE